uniref:CYTH domain-containing protein n=1 Tax=Xenopus tropicalis TaxID=8364 RepID=A0A6I8SJS3_XENTR
MLMGCMYFWREFDSFEMPRNVEIKARVRDWERTLQECCNQSKTPGELIKQRDVFFNSSHGRLKLRDFQDGQGQLIYYNRPDLVGPKLSDYSISNTTDPADLERVLTQALGVRGSVVKERLLFLVGQTRIHLDKVQSLGNFLELEWSFLWGNHQNVELGGELDIRNGTVFQTLSELYMENLGGLNRLPDSWGRR